MVGVMNKTQFTMKSYKDKINKQRVELEMNKRDSISKPNDGNE